MQHAPTPWLAVRREFGSRRALALSILAFVLPFSVWCAVSYLPFVWHPKVLILAKHDTALLEGKRYDPPMVERMNARALSAGKTPAGWPAGQSRVPAGPHEVLSAPLHGLHHAAPQPDNRQVVPPTDLRKPAGYLLGLCVGEPPGRAAGRPVRHVRPVLEAQRAGYRLHSLHAAPAFGTLMVAILGTQEAPKVAIIFIGTFFQMVLVLANTTRQTDTALLEAAQTLGARRWRLVTHVVIPGVLPRLYIDMRILLGWAWTYLIVAELIGEKSGITAYIQQQGRYFNFERVYAGIVSIGLLGLGTDQILRLFGRQMFPAQRQGALGFLTTLSRTLGAAVRRRVPAAVPASPTRETRSVDGAAS